MRALMTLTLVLTSIVPALAQARSPYLEDHTWPELRDLMAAGTTTAVVMAGGIEQNGPHMALGKHNVRAAALSAFQRRADVDLGGFRVSFDEARRSAGFVTQSMLTIDGRVVG